VTVDLPDGWDRDAVNRWIHYHATVALALTRERTALSSALVPVTPYILVAGVECYRRHPELVAAIAAARAPESIGAAGRGPGNQVDSVHLWSLANIYLIGRSVLAGAGLLDHAADVARTAVVLDFWQRAAAAFRADGHHQAWDAGGVVTPYESSVGEILDAVRPIGGDEERARVTRLNARLCSYLFLLYFDTRAGYQDTGPYRLPDGRVLLLRAFNKVGASDFAWSDVVAGAMPSTSLLAAFVLRDVDLHVTDFGTVVTRPDDYLAHVEGFGLFDVGDGSVVALDAAAQQSIADGARDAQRTLYRAIAAMSRGERIDAGAYVYFTFLRPFAEVAGIAGDLDWTVPRDSADLRPFLELVEETPEIAADPDAYYPPVP
jgi:hypothetical protein